MEGNPAAPPDKPSRPEAELSQMNQAEAAAVSLTVAHPARSKSGLK
jgi:hypothetical protein